MPALPTVQIGPYEVTRLILGHNPQVGYSHWSPASKPCLALKVLGAGRRCASQEKVRSAIRWAFANIKPTDAVVVGVFQKDEDQLALNVDYALEALRLGR